MVVKDNSRAKSPFTMKITILIMMMEWTIEECEMCALSAIINSIAQQNDKHDG